MKQKQSPNGNNKAVKWIVFLMVTAIIGWAITDEEEQGSQAEQLAQMTSQMGGTLQNGDVSDLQRTYDSYANSIPNM